MADIHVARLADSVLTVIDAMDVFMTRDAAPTATELDTLEGDLLCAVLDARLARATLDVTSPTACDGMEQPCLFCGKVH